MSALFEIIEKLQDTEAAMAMAERAAARNPNSPTMAVTIQSILKRREELRNRFSEIAKQNVLDVCSYRVFSEDQYSIKIASLANVLHAFQSLFTTVYDAIKNGPKERAKPDAATVAQTAFDFGYCFSGSAGIVMTMPDELTLFGEGDFDDTISQIFEMAKSRSPDQIATYARRLGIASVRKMYQWTVDHVHSGTGADIQWIKDKETKHKLFIQIPELQELQRAIAETSEEVEEVVELTGTLVGLDVDLKKFHMKFPDAEDIRGEISPAIGTRQTLELPKLYTVDVLRKKKVKFSTETEEVSHFLLKIK